MKKGLDFFRRTPNNSKGNDTKAKMINLALNDCTAYHEIGYVIDNYMETPQMVDNVIFSLARVTGDLLKVLDNEGYPMDRQYQDMLSVWLNDVDGDTSLFDNMKKRFDDYQRIVL